MSVERPKSVKIANNPEIAVSNEIIPKLVVQRYLAEYNVYKKARTYPIIWDWNNTLVFLTNVLIVLITITYLNKSFILVFNVYLTTGLSLIYFAGTPPYIHHEGTSFVTTAPDAITAPS